MKPTTPILTAADLRKLPLPDPVERIPYGPSAQQFGELRMPTAGSGPFPVLVLLHGGCWRNHVTLTYITPLAQWFAERGVATWVPEYRRLGDEGGGWPGTFLDVGMAFDMVRKIAEVQPIDPQRVFAAGHSAGGQLALWLASRNRLHHASDLFRPDPLTVAGVIGLAAITDLDEYRHGPPESCNASVEMLMGGGPSEFDQRYADASPMRRLPLDVPQIFIHGLHDDIVPVETLRAYIDAATTAGDAVQILQLPSGGHFEPAVLTEASENARTVALDWITSRKHPRT
ncbi:alpha/beta hydrolase family protein [Burkholderia stagnalis]